MAFNKAKALQEAHKYVAQGKISRAVKQYELIAEKDPGDLILLNVIGDLYAQENHTADALKYFYRLADAYSREGYNVKAIAIYKKISKIDQGKADPLLRLAELQLAQGFAREAREQYRNVFQFYDRAGQKEKALEILRKLCQLDPKSVRAHLRLAEFAERVGENREAAEAYLAASSLARDSGDGAAAGSALTKAAELAPENPEVHLYRARQALAEKHPEDIQAILDSVPELESNPQAKRLLLESDLAIGNLDAARDVLLEVFKSNPSDFSAVAAFSARCIEKQRYEAALEALAAAAPDVIARRQSAPLMEALRELWKASPEQVDILEFIYQVAEQTADEATIPEVLEALGNAHVQRDQLEEAEKAFARLVAREPENETYKDLLRKVLEKQGKEYVPLNQTPLISADVGLEAGPELGLGGSAASVDPEQAAIVRGAISNSDFFARDGLTERAVEELEKVLRVYPEQREIHQRILEVCREKLPARAVQAAEVLARVCAEQGESSEAKRYHEEALELAQPAAGAEADLLLPTQEASPAQPAGTAGLSPATVEIDLSQPDGRELQEEDGQLPPPQDISLQFQNLQEAGSSAGDSGGLADGAHGQQTAPDTPHQEQAAEAPPFNYEESREEIEFYLRHGFHDEAQKAVAELESLYPEEARVAEFRQRVGPVAAEAVQPDQGNPERSEWDLPTSFSGAAETGVSAEESNSALKTGSGGGRGDGAEDLAGELASTLEGFQGPASVPGASASQPGQAGSSGSAADASAELGSLLDELNDTNESIDQADDEQTHYNLGVAFREMGLFDEAIGEFQKVVKGTGPYFLQGCTLLASCFMDKEMPAIAAKWYLRALDAPDLNHEGTLALHYDLGVAYERAGNTTAALEKFTEVYSQNIDYRDVAEKIRLLRQASR